MKKMTPYEIKSVEVWSTIQLDSMREETYPLLPDRIRLNKPTKAEVLDRIVEITKDSKIRVFDYIIFQESSLGERKHYEDYERSQTVQYFKVTYLIDIYYEEF